MADVTPKNRSAVPAPSTDPAYDALERITQEQPAVLQWLRDNGVVFRRPISFSTDDASWESIAFWIYTALCRVDHIARSELLARAEADRGGSARQAAERALRRLVDDALEAYELADKADPAWVRLGEAIRSAAAADTTEGTA